MTEDLLGKNPFHETCPTLWSRARCTAQAAPGLGGLGARRWLFHPACLPARAFIGAVAPSGSASTLLGHLLPREGSVYRDSHCHLRGHPRGSDGDPQTPSGRPRRARHALRNSGKDGGRVSVQSGTLATWQDFTFRSMLGPESPTERNLAFHMCGYACPGQLYVGGRRA